MFLLPSFKSLRALAIFALPLCSSTVAAGLPGDSDLLSPVDDGGVLVTTPHTTHITVTHYTTMTHTTTTPISVTLSSGASKAQETSDPSGDDGSDDPGDDDGSASLSDFPTPSIPFPSGNSNGVAPAGVNNIVTSSCLVTAFMITIALSL